MSGAAGKVALVTGGARGIGLATCRELAEAGWRVAVADLDLDLARERAAELGEAGFAVALDVTEPESPSQAVAAVIANAGRLDLLVNNAGIQRHGLLETIAWEDWAAVLEVNLHGVFRCMQAAAKVMLGAGSGAVVNVVSVAAERGTPGRSPYVAAKAAVVGLTRTAAVEWAGRGVRCNAVGPGYVDTELMRSYIDDGRVELEPILARTPVGRLASPAEVARAIRFLGSDESSFVTGQVLYVDGGFLADYGVPSAGAESGRK